MGISEGLEKGASVPTHGVYTLSQYDAFELRRPHVFFDTNKIKFSSLTGTKTSSKTNPPDSEKKEPRQGPGL
jgi:hypothetical protein